MCVFNTRLPAPKLPPIHLFSQLIGSSISISIVSFAINFSMAKLFATKYKYTLDSNQVTFFHLKMILGQMKIILKKRRHLHMDLVISFRVFSRAFHHALAFQDQLF